MTERLAKPFFGALLFAVLGVHAHANMVLSNVILHFEPGEPTRQDVEIENTGDAPMYVQVSPHVVASPGTEQEARVPVVDPRDAGLLVTPNKLVVPPNGRKLLRFVNLDPTGENERVYRVAVTPVVGDLEAEQSGLKILIGYEVLVLVKPVIPAPELDARRVGTTLHFENRGNTNVLLREGRQCPMDDVPIEQCTILPSKRLYPGNSWAVELPYDREVEYYLASGTRNSVELYR